MQFNGAITNLGACIATIVGVPIVEGCIFQFVEKKRNRAISSMSKYICGFLLAIVANACAMLVEQMRRDSPIHMSDISAWYAFIPMFLNGFVEILVNPDICQFAFAAALNQRQIFFVVP